MKKVLVTGAGGFIGRHLVAELLRHNFNVIAVVHNDAHEISNTKTICCSMERYVNLPDLIDDKDIDTCIHLSWGGSTGSARGDYDLQLANIKYSMDLVRSLVRMEVKTFVGVGTLAEQDVQIYHPTDGATPNLVSIYGVAKMAAHYMTKAMCTQNKIQHKWAQLANVYGEGNRTSNFVNFASKLMLRGERAAFTKGEQWYDFIYIDDAARALYAVAEFGKENVMYYIGSGAPKRLKDYITCIRDCVDPTIKLYFGEIPFNGISLRKDMLDTSKLITDTGFCPQVSFEHGIIKTLDWIKKGEPNGIAI